MSDLSAGAPQPPSHATVLEYRRLEPGLRQISDRARRNLIGGLIAIALCFAFLTAMTCQWNYPADQQARNTNGWLGNELQRRIYERAYRKGFASGQPPPVATPVIVHAWASVLMTIGDGTLTLLALFSHRLVRGFDRVKAFLTPQRTWNAMLAVATVQLLLALACVGTDAWRVFTNDFVYVGWVWAGLLASEFTARIFTGASLPNLLDRTQFSLKTNEQMRR